MNPLDRLGPLEPEPSVAPQGKPQPEARGYSISGVELRGYEVAKLIKARRDTERDRWEVIGKMYTPNEWGYNKALKEATWWHEHHPETQFMLRPVISIDPRTLQQPPSGPAVSTPEKDTNGNT